MQFLLELPLKVQRLKKTPGNTKLKPRSQQKIPYRNSVFRVLALRENENLIDWMMKDLLNYYYHFYG